MDDNPRPVDPATVKFLRVLVTVLTGTMILGLVVLIGLFVIRFSAGAPPLPEAIELPEGVAATAVTVGDDWYAVVTRDDRILVFDRDTGRLRQSVQID